MRSYPRLWWRLLRRCYSSHPGLTVAALACRLLSLVTVPGSALAVRAALDASATGLARAAAIGAVGAALAQTLNVTVEQLGNYLKITLVDRVGLLVLDAEILSDVCGIDGMDHLERTDFLDRIAVLRGGSWGVLASAWNALDTVINVVRLAIMLALLTTVSPLLLLLLAFAAVPLWFDARGQRAVVRTETGTAGDIRLERHLFELATGAGSGKEIRISGAGPELLRRQAAAYRRAYDARFRARLSGAGWRAGGWAVYAVGFAVALGLVVSLAIRGGGSLGDVVLTITIAASLRSVVQQTVSRTTLTTSSAVLLEPYLWLRDYAARERGRQAGVRPAPSTLRDGLRLDRLSYRYPGTQRDAVHDVTAHLPAGSIVAVVGEYGSGKSTLVKLLCGFHQPTGGSILVDGTDLAVLDIRSWRTRMAVAFQDFGRYRTRLRDVIGLGDLAHMQDERRIRQAVAAADATGLVERLPDGLATMLGREFGGVELSEGQWQKTALARACMRAGPLLFVIDEPTASLDAPSERAIFEGYVSRARDLAARAGTITVIVSHRFSTVADADLILVMDGGRLVEIGEHETLLAANGTYAELHGISRRAYTLDPE